MDYSEEQIKRVCELKKLKHSHRDISEMVFGVRTRASVVYRILRKHYYPPTHKELGGSPKILVLDIETAPILSYHWGLWQQNVGLNMILRDQAVISWSAKWVGVDYVMYDDCREFFDGSAESMFKPIDDKELVKGIWELLNEADVIITQNGKKFDVKKLNAAFLKHGMVPPSSYKHIDTLQIAKRHFGFTSNKLEYMTDKFCKVFKKLKHSKFAGFDLWKECQLGNPLAWDEMEEYNKYDSLSLEELAFILAPWSNQIPNMDMYYNDHLNHCMCGGTDWVPDGFAFTGLSKFARHKCVKCGSEKRSRVNLLSKDKMKTLKLNVAG